MHGLKAYQNMRPKKRLMMPTDTAVLLKKNIVPMKVYKVMASGYSDEDDISALIVASSPERALEIAKKGQQYD